MQKWLAKLADRKEPPTQEHTSFLSNIIDRLIEEAAAEQKNERSSVQSEPPFYLIHGVPGAGKSRLIALLREMFTQVLHWEHGVQFQCLAPQNTMAALIGGATLHSWGDVPINHAAAVELSKKKRGQQGVDGLFVGLAVGPFVGDEVGIASIAMSSMKTRS